METLIAILLLPTVGLLNQVWRNPSLDQGKQIIADGDAGLDNIRIDRLQERPPGVRQRLAVRENDRVIAPAPAIAIVCKDAIDDGQRLGFVLDQEGAAKWPLLDID